MAVITCCKDYKIVKTLFECHLCVGHSWSQSQVTSHLNIGQEGWLEIRENNLWLKLNEIRIIYGNQRWLLEKELIVKKRYLNWQTNYCKIRRTWRKVFTKSNWDILQYSGTGNLGNAESTIIEVSLIYTFYLVRNV